MRPEDRFPLHTMPWASPVTGEPPMGSEGGSAALGPPGGLAACRTLRSVTETGGGAAGQPFWGHFMLLAL